MVARPAYDLSALKVMIVDDSDHMLRIVRTLLQTMNIRDVRSVSNPEEAFVEIQARQPDLIIVDWNMIPFDGLEFVRRIRRGADSPQPDIPILLLTAHTEAARVLEARDNGVNRVMAKPVSFRTLYDNIVATIEDERPFVTTPHYVGPDRRYRKGKVVEGRGTDFAKRALAHCEAAQAVLERKIKGDGGADGAALLALLASPA